MSLKGTAYETVEEAHMRLQGSVVLYDGEPVYITAVKAVERQDEGGGRDIFRVYAVPLPYGKADDVRNGNDKQFRKYISSKKFDLSPFPMGWCSYGRDAYYLSRIPARQARQGLTSGNLKISAIGGRPIKADYNSLVSSEEFKRCVTGKYEDVEIALARLNGLGDDVVVPVGRSFAFVKDVDIGLVYLYHKNTKCGFTFGTNKGFTLPDKYKFLREEAEENRIQLA